VLNGSFLIFRKCHLSATVVECTWACKGKRGITFYFTIFGKFVSVFPCLWTPCFPSMFILTRFTDSQRFLRRLSSLHKWRTIIKLGLARLTALTLTIFMHVPKRNIARSLSLSQTCLFLSQNSILHNHSDPVWRSDYLAFLPHCDGISWCALSRILVSRKPYTQPKLCVTHQPIEKGHAILKPCRDKPISLENLHGWNHKRQRPQMVGPVRAPSSPGPCFLVANAMSKNAPPRFSIRRYYQPLQMKRLLSIGILSFFTQLGIHRGFTLDIPCGMTFFVPFTSERATGVSCLITTIGNGGKEHTAGETKPNWTDLSLTSLRMKLQEMWISKFLWIEASRFYGNYVLSETPY